MSVAVITRMFKVDKHISKSFDENFCVYLEFHLTESFDYCSETDLNGFWCDGVACKPFFDRYLTRDNFVTEKKIVTESWMGKTGQDKYEMTINFGKNSYLACLEGQDLKEFIPNFERTDWYLIDLEDQKIQIDLL